MEVYKIKGIQEADERFFTAILDKTEGDFNAMTTDAQTAIASITDALNQQAPAPNAASGTHTSSKMAANAKPEFDLTK